MENRNEILYKDVKEQEIFIIPSTNSRNQYFNKGI